MTEKIDIQKLSNGMTIIGSEMPDVASAAFDFFLPAGAAIIPKGFCGAAAVIKDWMFRGAGENSSKQLLDKIDGLGLHRGEKVNAKHLIIGSALEAGNTAQALELYADIITKPTLDPKQFEFSKQLAIAELMGLEDDPRQKTLLQLRQNFYPDPLGRSPLGVMEELQSLSAEKCKEAVLQNFNISETIFAIAGKYDFDAVCTQIEKLFGEQKPKKQIPLAHKEYLPNYAHTHYDGAQVHIGIMCPTEPAQGPDYYNARVAIAVLSGGMSSRLFTEVREKRALCYAVGASYNCLKEMAGLSCYAGTTPGKSQETYEVIISELEKLSQGITTEELKRAKAGLKSALVMQSESSSARSINAAADYYMLGRVRGLEEIKEKIEAVTIESVYNFLKNNPFQNFTVVTIGPEKLNLSQ